MNKVLTRRAREYFEVLDSLREEGYATYEEWQLLDPKKQAETPRMTVRTIEDALLEYGYSKGSSNEQKKYRILWMNERGILPEAENSQARLIQDDPIVGAATAIRKQLQDEAAKEIAEEKRKADEIVKEVNAKYSNLQTQLTNLNDKYSESLRENEALKNKLEKLEANLLSAIKDKIHLESDLEAKSRENLKDKVDHAKFIADEAIKSQELKKDNQDKIDSLTKRYQEDMSALKEINERHEKQRHDYIVEIDNYKVQKINLEKEIGKFRELEQKLTRANIELTQHLRRLEDETDSLKKENKELGNKFHSIMEVSAGTKGELKQLQTLFSHQKEDYQNANKVISEQKERIGRLQEQLHQAKDELVRMELEASNK